MELHYPVIGVAVAFLVTFAALLAVVLFARLGVVGPNHPLKRFRYEAGNPPRGSARIAVPPQYYGYALVFLVVDTVFVLLFLLSLAERVATLWTLIAFVILMPPLIYALRYARDLSQWY